MKTKKPRSAFSLIEAAIVLGIVGLVIGGIWVAAARISERNKLNRIVEQVIILAQNARAKLKDKLPSGSSITFKEDCSNPQECIPRAGWANYIPSDMISAASNLPVTPYGTQYFIGVTNSTMSVGIFLGDNVSACAQLGPMIYNIMRNERAESGGPFNVVNGTSGTDLSTPTDNGAECQNELDNEGNTVVAFTLTL